MLASGNKIEKCYAMVNQVIKILNNNCSTLALPPWSVMVFCKFELGTSFNQLIDQFDAYLNIIYNCYAFS